MTNPRTATPTASGRRRQGVTLIELLVVVGIIGLLAAITLPAVQYVRAAARRSACQGKLRDMGLALTQYAEVHGRYPVGWYKNSMSTQAMLLPYLGEQAVYDRLNFDHNSGTGPNLTVLFLPVNVFLCPADSIPQRLPVRAYTNYLACLGRGEPWFATDVPFEFHSPINSAAYHTRPRDIADGLSHTAGFSETAAGDDKREPKRTMYPIGFDAPADAANRPEFLERCRQAKAGTPGGTPKGTVWLTGSVGGTLYNHLLGPNGNSCQAEDNHVHNAVTASSLHAGGVGMALLDGSVRFVPDSIDLKVWRAYATPAHGELDRQ